MTTQNVFNLNVADLSWRSCLENALKEVAPDYIALLSQCKNWLPGPDKIFSAFSLPINKVNYILFGESPYPRIESANGYAFWDAAVTQLWSETGLSKAVNRATSLRNIIKMLLVADGALDSQHTGQSDIASLDKSHYVQTNAELFANFIDHGFLLLNASLVLQATPVRKDALCWHPFIKHVLDQFFLKKQDTKLVLFGNIANTIDKVFDHFEIERLYAEHPYNLSFISNPEVIEFFKPLRLLYRKECQR